MTRLTDSAVESALILAGLLTLASWAAELALESLLEGKTHAD